MSEAEEDGPGRAAGPPADLHALRALIAQRQGTLPRRLLQAGEFVLAHPEDVALGTAVEIAEKAAVQPSTLVRFAQALGYNGFSELQTVFRMHARERWPEYGERLRAIRERGSGALLAGFAGASRLSIDRLEGTLDMAALDGAVALLAAAPAIHLVGARRAFPVVSYLAYALAKLGITAHLIDQFGGLAPEQIDLIGPADAVLAVSFTPYTPSTLELSQRAARRGIAVVAITDTPFSPLIQSARLWLEVADADHAAFRSLAGTLVLAMTLAVAVAERREELSRGAGEAGQAE